MAKTSAASVELEPIDRLEEKLKRLVSVVERLKTEQARGSYDIARYYERHRKWAGAKIYYNDVVSKDPNSRFAEDARQHIDAIKQREPK